MLGTFLKSEGVLVHLYMDLYIYSKHHKISRRRFQPILSTPTCDPSCFSYAIFFLLICYIQACFDISVSQNVNSKPDNVSFICLHAVHKHDYNILSLARIIIYHNNIPTLHIHKKWHFSGAWLMRWNLSPTQKCTPGLHWPRISAREFRVSWWNSHLLCPALSLKI